MTNQTKVKGIVDIVFLIDATGSMGTCIDALKNNISVFIDTLSSADANGGTIVQHWRAKVCGYRDAFCDTEYFIDNPFVEDTTELKSQLAGIDAKGGGDEPETLLDALYSVINQGQMEKTVQELDPHMWRHRSKAARVVIVFTDASFQPRMKTLEHGTVDDVINKIHENRIILSLFAPDMACHHALAEADRSEFNVIEYNESDPSGAQKALAEFTADPANFKETMKMLAKSVSASAGVPL